MNFFALDYESLSAEIEMSPRSITNYTWNDKPLGGIILRKVHAHYGVSVDWLLSGTGEMLLPTQDAKAMQYLRHDAHAASTHTVDDQARGQYDVADCPERLIDTRLALDTTALSDAYVLYAQQIEQALLDIGAVPEKDFRFLDLITLAQRHVLADIEKGEDFKVLQNA